MHHKKIKLQNHSYYKNIKSVQFIYFLIQNAFFPVFLPVKNSTISTYQSQMYQIFNKNCYNNYLKNNMNDFKTAGIHNTSNIIYVLNIKR